MNRAEFRERIKTYVAEHSNLDPILAAERAYALELTKKVGQAKSEGERSAVASLQSRAVAQTLNPAAPGAQTPTRFTNFEDALKHFNAKGR